MLDQIQAQEYLYKAIDENQRNQLQHLVLRPTIHKVLTDMLENYGLRQRLEAARNGGSQVSILEAGSGSGSFLRDFADLLQGQGLLQAADLNGLDIDIGYLDQAEKLDNQNPAWSNIHYYQHNITVPLEQNLSLSMEKKLQFDCICATVLLQYLPNCREHLLRLYNYLKPGGIIYLCDSYMSYEGEKAWQAPNPTIAQFGVAATKLVRDMNGGKIVAEETANWLREMGAEQVQTVDDLIEAAGSDQRGIEVLRYYISVVRGASAILLKLGLINQAKYDSFLAAVFEINKNSKARLPFIHTIARKPA
jgi:SAM-dependent methyltransferase